MEFPQLQNDQHAVITVEVSTGIVLRHDGQRFTGSGEAWRVFESLAAAREFAQAEVAAHPSHECSIYRAPDRPVQTLKNEEHVATLLATARARRRPMTRLPNQGLGAPTIMKGTETSSPQADRKALRLVPAFFMIAAWLAMLALLVYWFVLWPTPALFLYIWFDVLFALFLLPLVLIPIQVVRYFRRKRL